MPDTQTNLSVIAEFLLNHDTSSARRELVPVKGEVYDPPSRALYCAHVGWVDYETADGDRIVKKLAAGTHPICVRVVHDFYIFHAFSTATAEQMPPSEPADLTLLF